MVDSELRKSGDALVVNYLQVLCSNITRITDDSQTTRLITVVLEIRNEYFPNTRKIHLPSIRQQEGPPQINQVIVSFIKKQGY